MDSERAEARAVVRASIEEYARAERAQPSVRHVGLACARAMAADGVAVSLVGDAGVYEPMHATNSWAEQLAELEVTVGEGPGMEAVQLDRPVLAGDLDAPAAQRRWPLYAPAAVEMGALKCYAFPLLVGAIAVGVLEVFWQDRPAPEGLVGDGLLYADAALVLVLSAPVGGPAPLDAGEPLLDRWPEVHQATGIVSVQLDVDLATAFARLRAHAYANEQSLREVAREVVRRRLRFRPEPDAGQAG